MIDDGNERGLDERSENQPPFLERPCLVVGEHHVHFVLFELLEQGSTLMMVEQDGNMALVVEQHGG